jgi:DNA primase
MVSPSIQDIKHQVRLENVVQKRGVMLRPTQGSERLEGHCPFHVYDATPSFNIYLRSQRYHCFGCGANGDIIDFVQAFDLCSCQEALARLSGNILPLVTQKLLNSRLPRRVLPVPFPGSAIAAPAHQAILTTVVELYHQTLLNNHALCEALLHERGITHAGITACHLGYADGSLPAFHRTSQWHQEEQLLLQNIGVLTARHRECLYGRMIIPEWNQGACTWMIGRQFPSSSRSVGRHTSPKYLGLSLRKPLLGAGRGIEQLQKKELVRAILVVEGAIDYVIATQWSLPLICVALIGTHASTYQFATLLDLQQRAGHVPILLALDADEVGIQASRFLSQRLQKLQRPVWTLPPIEQAKDLGDLGVHPHGYSLITTTINQALEQVSGGTR